MAVRFRVALVVALTTLLVDLGGGDAVAATEPASALATLRRHLDAVFTTLQSPAFLEKDADGRREAVRQAGGRLFNWTEMSRRALGAHWNERTPAERRAFAAHFERVAERSYLSQVTRVRAGHALDEPVRYLREGVQGRETIVHTRLAYLRDIPADFHMQQRAGRWEVCDITFDGVSAAENYRAQFDRLLSRDSYPALLGRMT